MDTGVILLDWYQKNHRQLPMRQTNDPYLTWISEVIFQQTRIEQGLPYYYKFIKLFPDVNALASATEDSVLKAWQGLGYYSRARNLITAAKYISNQLNGKFPTTYNNIIKLKGIGPYTAAAIASWCFGEKVTAIDGNVYRALSRLFDSDVSLKNSSGKAYYNKLGLEIIKEQHAGMVNQALIELGSMVCTPQNPNCSKCPLITKCLSFKNNTIPDRPLKEEKTKVTQRYFNYIVPIINGKTLLKKRTDKDIWKGLYEFILIETNSLTKPESILSQFEKMQFTNKSDISILKIIPFPKQKLSHQVIHCTFYIIVAEKFKTIGSYQMVDPDREVNLPLPIILQKFIDNYFFDADNQAIWEQ
jgi:A/G-specific adenine glycosylase